MGGDISIAQLQASFPKLLPNTQDSQNFQGGQTAAPNAGGGWWGVYPPTQPSICPGCGRCKECGHPAPNPIYPSTPPIGWPYGLNGFGTAAGNISTLKILAFNQDANQ